MKDISGVTHNESSVGLVNEEENQLELFFKMHERINAKNEEISKSYSNNILVTIKDIQELHFKTMQSINSLQPAMSQIGIRIAVSHNEGESEKFNSFEEFLNHNKTSPNPTSNIQMTYAFTLHDVENTTFENYKVKNMVRSRVAEISQIEKEAPSFISKAIISSIVTTTAMTTIEYSDYVKARHFTAMFDEWIRGCDESKSMGFINTLKKVSDFIPQIGLMIIYALMAYFTASAIDAKFVNSDYIVKFVVIYASVFLIVRGLCQIFLRKVEESINGYLALSFLNISKGDAKIIKAFSSRNRYSILWAIGGLIGTVSVGIFTSVTYDFIKWLLLS
jgi:hypothetical protein